MRLSCFLIYKVYKYFFQNETISLPDDAKAVKVAASSLGTKRFLERDDHICYVVTVPDWTKNTVSKSEKHLVAFCL